MNLAVVSTLAYVYTYTVTCTQVPSQVFPYYNTSTLYTYMQLKVEVLYIVTEDIACTEKAKPPIIMH